MSILRFYISRQNKIILTVAGFKMSEIQPLMNYNVFI